MSAALEAIATAEGEERVAAETVAHALLRMIADRPGHVGRARGARIVGGFAVAYRDGEEEIAMRPYVVECDWKLRELVELVDAMISGGLIAQTVGPRPVLVLTRAGHHALNALEGLA